MENLSFSCTSASPRHPRFIVSGELAYKFKLPASVRRVVGAVQDTDKPSIGLFTSDFIVSSVQIDRISTASSSSSPLR